MDRGFKYRVPGVVFYLFLLVPLILTKNGESVFRQIFIFKSDAGLENVVLPLLSFGAALLTSEGVGFIFVTIVYAIFNLFGGYSSWLKRIRQDLLPKVGFEEYSTEIKLVYNYWYKVDEKGNPYDGWVIRRWTSYFTNYSSVLAIVCASLVSIYLIGVFQFGFSPGTFIWYRLCFLFIVSLIINSECARKETVQIIKLFVKDRNTQEQKNRSDEPSKFRRTSRFLMRRFKFPNRGN